MKQVLFRQDTRPEIRIKLNEWNALLWHWSGRSHVAIEKKLNVTRGRLNELINLNETHRLTIKKAKK